MTRKELNLAIFEGTTEKVEAITELVDQICGLAD